MGRTKRKIPIIDSHIHVYPRSELHSVAWLSPDHPLARQWSIDDYRESIPTDRITDVQGFVAVESDRKTDPIDGLPWEGPLMEISWFTRIANGEPRPNEGHRQANAQLCLALIPWAPINRGPKILEQYLDMARQRAGSAWSKVRGFRYLLQGRPPGSGTTDDFIEGLRFLGKEGFLFEACLDHHRDGHSALNDVVTLVEKASQGDGGEQVTVVIDHILKPNMKSPAEPKSADFQAWSSTILHLASFPKVYIKISGSLSEISNGMKNQGAETIAEHLQPWFDVVLEAFGPKRMMFGSDWPICTLGVKDSWSLWREVVESMCWAGGLKEDDVFRVFAGTAGEAYGIRAIAHS